MLLTWILTWYSIANDGCNCCVKQGRIGTRGTGVRGTAMTLGELDELLEIVGSDSTSS